MQYYSNLSVAQKVASLLVLMFIVPMSCCMELEQHRESIDEELELPLAPLKVRTADQQEIVIPVDIIKKSKTLMDLEDSVRYFGKDNSEHSKDDVTDLSEIENIEIIKHIMQLCQMFDKYMKVDASEKWQKYINTYFANFSATNGKLLSDIMLASNYLALQFLVDSFSRAAIIYLKQAVKENKSLDQILLETRPQSNALSEIGVRNELVGYISENIGGKNIRVESAISDFCISPDGKTVAIGLRNGKFQLWDIREGALIKTVHKHSNKAVRNIVFSPDGGTLLMGSDDSVGVWNIKTGLYRRVRDYKGSVEIIKFAPNGEYFVVVVGDTIYKYSLKGKIIQSFEVPTCRVDFIDFLSDGQRIITACSAKNSISIFRSNGRPIQVLRDHSARIAGLVAAPNKETFASIDEKGAVKIWDATAFTNLSTIQKNSCCIQSPAYSPDSSKLLVIFGGEEVQIIDVQAGSDYYNFKDGKSSHQANWIPESDLIMTIGKKAVSLWNMNDGSKVKRFQTLLSDNPKASFDSDGNYLVFLRNSNTLKIYALADLKNDLRPDIEIDAAMMKDLTFDQLITLFYLVDAEKKNGRIALKPQGKAKETFELLPQEFKMNFKNYVR